MTTMVDDKKRLRAQLRARRLAFWDALPERHRALVFARPPGFILPLIAQARTIGLYRPVNGEAPTQGYAAFFQDQGARLALPWFADRASTMRFRAWAGLDDQLVVGPFGVRQPSASMPLVEPDALFLPLLGFDAALNRLGQGGGHYDRYLAENPGVPRLGLAWSVQQVENLPCEPHDQPLDAVITEQRAFVRQEGQN